MDPDLVGWWTFEEGSGSTVADQTGKGHDGKLVGDVKWCDGKIGGAIAIGGGSSGLEVADAEDLRIGGDLTMALWVRKSAELPDWACLMGRGNRDERNYGLWLEPRSKKYMYQQYGGGDLNLKGAKLVEIGTWTHLAVTVQQEQVMLYYNGDLDGQTKRPALPWTGAAPLGLGYAMRHAALIGALDDVRLYRRALTAPEIRALYQGR
jgi:hypothetical protein